jgi:hypothetical protein
MSDHDCGKCCPGPVGPMGPQGNQGIQGIKGDAGLDGLNGLNGLQGEPGRDGRDGHNGQNGEQGIPGPQGLQGVPGDCVECPCHCDEPEFAQVYSLLPQTLVASSGALLPGQVVLFENTVVATAAIDVSQVAINGKITINKAGWYDVSSSIAGFLNPIDSPFPCWTVSLFKNGILIPASTFANQTISPDQQCNEIMCDTYVHFNKGDVLEVANTTSRLVNLASPILGTNAPASSANLKLKLFKAD